MKELFKKVSLLLAVMLCAVPALAQVTTSAISGHVTDKAGAVAGVTVVAVHQPTATTYYAVTDKNGNYRISNVTAGGPYTVTFDLMGYRELQNQNVYAPLAETITVDAALEDDSISLEGVVVVADAVESNMNIKRSGAGTSVSQRAMENLPTSTGRSLNDVLRLTPQATTSGSGFSVGGGNYRSSYITVDGAAFNNAFGIGSNLPAGGSPISLDAIEQMSINITPYDVRQGGFTGAAVNSVTKRGTNEFKVSVYDYYTSGKLSGRKYVDAAGQKGELASSDAVSNTVGASVGGPIIKDKLFFFLNVEYEPKTSNATSWTVNDGSWSADGSGTMHRPTEEQMESIKSVLAEKYGYDPGRYQNFSVETPVTKLLGRIDWNINRNNSLTLRYSQVTRKTNNTPSSSVNPIGDGANKVGYVRNTGGRTSTYALPFESTYYFSEDNFYSFAGELNSRLFDGRGANLLRVTYSQQNIPRSFYGDTFPTVDILDGDQVLTSFGPDPFTYGNLRDVATVVATDEFSYTAGMHNLLAGVQYEHNRTKNGFMQGGAGWYVYSSLDDFINDATPLSFCITHGNNDNLDQVYPSFDYNQFSAYLQDEMNISNNFKLTAGLRFELPMYPSIEGNENKNFTAVYENYGGYKTSDMPSAHLSLSPRIGFNWDILGNRDLVLRGGTGVYTGRIPFVWIVSVAGNSNCLQNQVIMTADAIRNSTDGKVNGVNIPHFHTNVKDITDDLYGGTFVRNENLSAPSQATVLDKNLKMPTTWKASLALDANLPYGIKGSLEGIVNKNFNSTIVRHIGYTEDGTLQMPGEPAARTKYTSINEVGNVHPYYITNPDKGVKQGYYASLTASLKKDFNFGLSLMAAYTYSVSKSLTDGDGDQITSAFNTTTYCVNGTNTPELGYNSFVSPNRLIVNANYTIREGRHLATNLGLFYEGYNFGYVGTFAGSRFSYTTDGDYTGCGGSANLLYIPTSSELSAMPFSSDANRNAYESYIASDRYLSAHRGEYAVRGGAVMPWYGTLSAKVSQDFIFNVAGRDHTLRLGADINNVGNLLNSAWGNVQQIKSAAAISLEDGVYTFNEAQCKFDTYANSISTWSILFSARYFF